MKEISPEKTNEPLLRKGAGASTWDIEHAKVQFIIKGVIILTACSLDMRKYRVKK